MGRTVYVCRVCHRVGARTLTCHVGKSAKCNAGAPGDERAKPLYDAQGNLVTRAPKWWVDACFKEKRQQGTKETSRQGAK
ncbi:MAG: hypothetical protein HY868_26080 [Chloroflexi bacterium]|nr:hypothetical protein [Chloroflexota bacterium]